MYNNQRPHQMMPLHNPQNRYQAPAEDKNKGKSYFLGFIGAIFGALLGALPWALVYYFGWFVGFLGFVIGIAASKGYDIFRGKSGKGKILIVLISAIIGVVAGNLLGDGITVGVMISNGEIEGAVMSDIPDIIMYTLFTSAEYLRGFFVSVGIGIIFVIIGMIGIFRRIAKENK